jgi:hypothetical protein
MSQSQFTLFGFFGEDVILKSMFEFNLTAGGNTESLLGS